MLLIAIGEFDLIGKFSLELSVVKSTQKPLKSAPLSDWCEQSARERERGTRARTSSAYGSFVENKVLLESAVCVCHCFAVD